MLLREALKIILDLAEQCVLEEKLADTEELQYERERQLAAVDIVGDLLGTYENDWIDYS
jgi:hypothetical protein